MKRDQAAGLRRLIEQRAKGVDIGFHANILSFFPKAAPVIVFSGAEDEIVSLATMTTNCALALGSRGERVTIIEAHSHDVNVPLLLGVQGKDILSGPAEEISFRDRVCACGHNVQLLRGIDVLENAPAANPELRACFYNEMREFLAEKSDCVFINEVTPRFSMSIGRVVLLCTPEHDSLVGAYARLKKIIDVNSNAEIYFIVTTTGTMAQAENAARNFSAAAGDFLKKKTVFLGGFPVTEEVIRSVKTQRPLVESCPFSREARCIQAIARKLKEALCSDDARASETCG